MIRYLSDLIWVGNVLYPRWFLLLIIAVSIFLIVGLVAFSVKVFA